MQTEFGTEISLKDIFLLIKKNLAGIVIFMECVIIVVSLFTFLFMEDQFTSSVVFSVVTKSEENPDASISQSALNANLQLVNDYKVIVNSRTVKEATAARLGLEDLKGYSISVNSEGTSSRGINIKVTGPSAYMAANIANTLYLEFKEQVYRLLKVENVAVIDSAIVPDKPSAPGREKIIILGAIAGVVLAIAFVIVRDILDTTIKTAEDVEKQLGLPVLAQIPKVEDDDTPASKKKNSKGGLKE